MPGTISTTRPTKRDRQPRRRSPAAPSGTSRTRSRAARSADPLAAARRAATQRARIELISGTVTSPLAAGRCRRSREGDRRVVARAQLAEPERGDPGDDDRDDRQRHAEHDATRCAGRARRTRASSVADARRPHGRARARRPRTYRAAAAMTRARESGRFTNREPSGAPARWRPHLDLAGMAAQAPRDPGIAALGTWSGGRFMHFGEPIDEDRLVALLTPRRRRSTRSSPPTSTAPATPTACSAARWRASRARSVCVIGAVGHDFYTGERAGAKGFPRFTDPALRGPERLRVLPAHGDRAQPRALRRSTASTCCCCTTPTASATRSEAVWEGMAALRDGGPDAHDRRRARPGQRLHARRDRLLRALRLADRLGDADPQPARALAGRARARRGRRGRRRRARARRRLRRALPRRRRPRATSSAPATTARSAPPAGSRRASSGSSGCARSRRATA